MNKFVTNNANDGSYVLLKILLLASVRLYIRSSVAAYLFPCDVAAVLAAAFFGSLSYLFVWYFNLFLANVPN